MAKIPPHATRVFKGIIYDVYHWEQKLFDGTTATFEALKRPNTVVVLPMSGETVYYAHQEQPGKPPFLSLFGGRADEGETPLETAQRELLEETGMTSDNWQQIRHYQTPGKVDWSIYFFVARNCMKASEQKLDAGEKINIRETSLDDFLNNIATNPHFSEVEMRTELLSAPNPEAFARLKETILGMG